MHQVVLGNFGCGVGGVSVGLINFYFWDWVCVGRVVGIWLSGLGNLIFVWVVSWLCHDHQDCFMGVRVMSG